MITPVAVHLEMIAEQMRARDRAAERFFTQRAETIARLSGRMAERFLQGGRILAFGVDAMVTDAQHVTVEFVHPVIAGKRALPAADLSSGHADLVPALARREDIVIGFAPPWGDMAVDETMLRARVSGAMCLALPGSSPDFTMPSASQDPFIHQEIVEMLYHMLWESVHVFLEHQPVGDRPGAAGFLYPFLGDQIASTEALIPDVAASIRAKAETVMGLRDQIISQGDAMVAAGAAIHDRVCHGATILTFGNGGSATDANDLAFDLVTPWHGRTLAPALSLSNDAATLTAISNDIGTEAAFVRQLIAHGRHGDVALAFSTSGGSANILAALKEARQRGMLTVAILGYDGGEIARQRLADHTIVIDSGQIPRIQEAHAAVYHVMVELLRSLSTR